jgi:hypothetical protein
VPRILLSGVFASGFVLCAFILLEHARPVFAQTAPVAEPSGAQVAPPPGSSSIIGEYWSTIYGPGGVDPARAPALAPAPSAPVPTPGGFRDFLDHLILRFGATYTHNFVEFTGRPTSTFIVDNGPAGTVTREGFSFPQVFTANDDQFYSYLVLGTRGYLEPRLNTYFSMIYRQDLSGITPGSPFQSILDAFQDGRRAQVLNAYAEWNGLGTGLLTNASIRAGRQFVFDTTPDLIGTPVIDGATLSYRDPKLELAVFSGRRVNFFGENETDIAFGGTATYNFLPRTSANVNYISLPGLHRYAFNLNHQIGEIHTGSYLTFRNTHPLQLGIRAWYAPVESPWTLRGTLYRQLTDEDFVYDMFADREPPSNDQERIRRLLLRQIRPATQVTLDVDRRITGWLTLGAGFAGRWVDGGEAPFDNSFEQVSTRATVSPGAHWDVLLGYRFRHVERSPVSEAAKAVFFDDISHAGETAYHEVSGEIYYRFGSNVRVRVGGYFGLFDSRDRLTQVNDIVMAGGYLRTQVRINRMMDARFEYGIDRGNPEFNPDIKRQHTVRAGFDFHY